MSKYAWGYFGLEQCERCHVPDHLFVNSYYGKDQYIACRSCLPLFSTPRDYNITDEDKAHFEDLYAHSPVKRPDLFPILEERLDVCHACYRPEFKNERLSNGGNWVFVEGLLKDGRMIIIHRRCSKICGDCGELYAEPDYHAIRTREDIVYGYDDFASISILDGEYRCDSCREVHYEENGGSENFFTCEYCEGEYHDDNCHSYEGSQYCERCYENNVYYCEDCDSQYWDGNGHDCSSEFIHSYSYRPAPYFFGAGRYHLGFELEVESNDNSIRSGAQLVTDKLGSHAYLKEDGSLSEGFEIVTHPHTLEKYQREFEWDTLRSLRREGFRSWDTSTCGLHVHISRTAFGTEEGDYHKLILSRQAHELRFMKLIYDNQRQVERIAGRSNNHYAQFSDKGKLVDKVKNGNQSDGRYSAVNTENQETLEVRVFRGSLRKERVLSALEFVTAATEYTRELPVSGKNRALSWLKFTAYVSNNEDTYPNLATIMSEAFANDPITQDQ